MNRKIRNSLKKLMICLRKTSCKSPARSILNNHLCTTSSRNC